MTTEEQKNILMKDIEQHGSISFHSRPALGRWAKALNELVSEGKIKTTMKEVDEQESFLLVQKI